MSDIAQHRRHVLQFNLGWLNIAILTCEALLFLSQQFQWFPFNTHKGWTVLIAMACMGAFFTLLLLWWTAAVLFHQRFQFSIRTLLTLFVVVAVPFSWLATEIKAAKRQANVTEWMKTRHIAWHYDWQCDADGQWVFGLNSPPVEGWLRDLLGDDFFADIVWVKVGCEYPSFPSGELKHLECLTRIKLLELVGYFTDADIEHLKGLKELKYLWLNHNCITDAGLKSIEGLTALNVLILDDNQIEGPGLEYLSGLKNLRRLSVQRMPITGPGVKGIAGLTQLDILDFRETQITDADMEHIRGLVSLRYLLLSETRLTGTGLKYLDRMTQLRVLFLNETNVGDTGIEHLRGLTQLQIVDLSKTKITNAGLKHLESLTQLQRLDLRWTNVTETGVQKLRAALPEIRSVRGG